MYIEIKAQSHVGLVRAMNEDMILADNRFLRDTSYTIAYTLPPGKRAIFALADGMGGHNAGEVASEQVLVSLRDFYDGLPDGLSSDGLIAAFARWNKEIHAGIMEMGRENPDCLGMGTTLVGFCIYGGRFYWFNCGDSRIYRLHEEKFCQLSTDHSYERLTGMSGYSNLITNCIGGGAEDTFLDMNEMTSLVSSGDLFLLCSDGLTDLVPDSWIERFLKTDASASQLVRMACHSGGRDNVSVCLVKITLPS